MRIKDDVTTSIEIERSIFIGMCFRVFSIQQANSILAQLRKDYSDASHITHGYIIGNTSHSSDDGEPAGTAGVPIKTTLEKNNLTEVMGVVIRYFGGIKLGAGGLIRAYSKAISSALSLAQYTTTIVLKEYSLTVDYALLNKIEPQLKNRVIIRNIDYAVNPIIVFRCQEDPSDLISSLTKGQYKEVYLRDIETEVIVAKED